MTREPKPTFNPAYIRDLSEKVYRLRLEQDCAGNIARMIEKDEDNGGRLRNRAGAYDPLTRAYLKVLGFDPGGDFPQVEDAVVVIRDLRDTHPRDSGYAETANKAADLLDAYVLRERK